jgi:hypothetical protein
LSIVLSLLALLLEVAQTAASGSATGFNDLGLIGSGASQGSAAGAIDADYGRNNSGAGTAAGSSLAGSGSFVSA